jgi:hypothetical protein
MTSCCVFIGAAARTPPGVPRRGGQGPGRMGLRQRSDVRTRKGASPIFLPRADLYSHASVRRYSSGSLTTGGSSSRCSSFFVLIIIVVGVSRRPRIVSDGDEAPVDQTGENFLGDAWGHVGSCLDVVTLALSPTGTQASTVMSTARRSNVAVSNLRSNSRARRQDWSSSVWVGGRAISAYLSRYLALAGSQKLSG